MQELIAYLTSGDLRGASHVKSGSARAGGFIVGRHVGIRESDAHSIQRQTEYITNDLSERSVGALADLCAARQQNCRAVGVKPHACRRSARRRRAFDGDGESFATDKRSGGYCRLFFVIAPT